MNETTDTNPDLTIIKLVFCTHTKILRATEFTPPPPILWWCRATEFPPPNFMVVSVLLIFLVFCVVMLCFVTFSVRVVMTATISK